MLTIACHYGKDLGELWRIFEPAPSSIFGLLDRYLLRRGLEESFRATHGVPPSASPIQFRNRVAAAVNSVRPVGGANDEWIDFITRVSNPTDPVILNEAAKHDPVGTALHHVQVLSRASLLL